MNNAKKLLEKIKKEYQVRHNIVEDESLEYKDKAMMVRKSIISFNQLLTPEEKHTIETEEFFKIHLMWMTGTEPKTRYEEYLHSKEWQELRLKVLKRSNFQCEGCGESNSLDIHHLTYDRIGDELLIDLVALCRDCHGKIHDKNEPSKWHIYLTENQGVNDDINT